MKFLTLACLGLLAVGASAQCANLTVTGTGAPGTALQFDLDGTTPHAFAVLLVGDTTGTTTVNLGPIGSLTLGLDMPFVPVPFGLTDANGDRSRTFNVPSTATMGFDLYGQAVTVGVSITMPPGGGMPSLTWTTCASNVASFHLGV